MPSQQGEGTFHLLRNFCKSMFINVKIGEVYRSNSVAVAVTTITAGHHSPPQLGSGFQAVNTLGPASGATTHPGHSIIITHPLSRPLSDQALFPVNE